MAPIPAAGRRVRTASYTYHYESLLATIPRYAPRVVMAVAD
jgi:hypothetical protein